MLGIKRLIKVVFLTLFSVVLLISGALAYLIVMPVGGKLLVRVFKEQFCTFGLMHVGGYTGSLQKGFVLKDVEIKGLTYLPQGLLRIQEVKVRLSLWDLFYPDIDIFNARLLMPDSDPVVFTGHVFEGNIKGNLYAKSLDLHEFFRFWFDSDVRKNLQGFVSNVDAIVQGPLSGPGINGTFWIDSIRFHSVVLTDAFSNMDLTLSLDPRQLQIKGEMGVDSGRVNVRNTNLQLSKSTFTFPEDIFNPVLDIHLGAKVEDMDFHLTIKGTMAYPQLTVSSDPPMAPQEALRVLFTGNAWASSTSPFNGVTSSQLAQDFLDYSLRDINAKDLGIKTRLTNNLKLGVEIDQTPSPVGETNTYYTRKLNGEMDLSEHMSLNVSQQVMPQGGNAPTSYQNSQSEAETQVYLQYKKRF
jgi:autotransporter translocation and assembly factor TamB